NHPHILRLFEAGAVTLPDGQVQYFIATEYLADGSLADLLTRSGGRLGEVHVLTLALAIAEALAYAHEHGVIHRDLKPSNILMRGQGSAILADFGIARSLTEQTITQGNRVMGTLAYMSPEQTLGDRSMVGRGSDIYSFGVMLYEMLSGYQPRTNPHLPDLVVVQMIQQQPFPSLREKAPHVSAELAQVVQRCLQPNRAQRYSTMQEVFNDLRRIAARQGVALPSTPTPRQAVPPPSNTSWLLIAGLVGGGVLLLLVILLFVVLGTAG
ncbi:MAG: serine/threonine protein kinase, partial [Candidatus Viridilinea halotolerans]